MFYSLKLFVGKNNMKSKINIILVILLLTSLSSYSQDIGIYVSKSWSEHYEIQNPIGGGLFISKSLKNDNFRINVDVSYSYNQREFYGRVISGFINPQDYSQTEDIQSTSRIYMLEVLGQIRLLQFDAHHFYGGTGFAVASFDGNRVGQDSGLKKELGEFIKVGVILNISYENKNIFDSPLNFIARTKYKYLPVTSNYTDVENIINGEMSIYQFQIGLSYSIL
jgi:hypothetical protein